MVNLPANPFTTKPGPPRVTFRVFIETPNAGDPLEEADHLRVVSVSRTAGGKTPDKCVLLYDFDRKGDDLEDLNTIMGWSRLVEVRVDAPLVFSDDVPVQQTLFWGELVAQAPKLDKGQRLTLEARITRFHFPDLLDGQDIYDVFAAADAKRGVPIVFNPVIDNTVEGNRDLTKQDGTDTYLFIDPEAARDPERQGLTEGVPAMWTMPPAIQRLCTTANKDQTYIVNPVIVEDDALWENAPELKNVRFPRGEDLPTALDRFLPPHGYDWTIDVAGDASGPADVSIRVFRRGSGPLRKFHFGRRSEEYAPDTHDAKKVDLQTNVVDLANVVIGEGALKQREITVELYRGWPVDDDGLTPGALDKTDPDSSYEAKPDVWRLWVGNESGEYAGLRPEITLADPDFSGIFPAHPIRRPLEDCLTLGENGKRRPPVVEYWEPGDEEWREVPSGWGVTVLPDRIGVQFSGDKPPGALVKLADDAKIRITGTIAGDTRITATKDRTGTSPASTDVKLFLDVESRFFERQVQRTGTFASAFKDLDPSEADERDDQALLDAYVDAVGKEEQAAGMRITVALDGIHTDVEIGDLVEEIAGRRISLNRNTDAAEEKRFPQVTGLQWSVTQTTVVTMDTPEAAPNEKLF